jgi:hypothetical protein
MTPAERTRAFNRARARIVRDKTGLMRATREDLVAMLRSAQRAIVEVMAAQPSDFERWSLPPLEREVRRALAEFGDQGGARISSAAARAWQLGEDLVDAPIEAAGVRVAGVLARIDTRQLTAMRGFMVNRIKDIGAEAANSISAELGLVVIGARSPSEAIGAVTEILGESSRGRATSIVRTELGRAFSSASQLRMAAAAEKLPGLKKQWRRSGKLHPRLHHDLADGQIVDVDQPFVLKPFGKPAVHLMYPRDPAAPAGETINCGCESIPYMESWDVSSPGRKPGSPMIDDSESVSDILDRPAPARRSRAAA